MKNYHMYVPKGGHAPIQTGCTTIAYQHKTYHVVFDGELYNQEAVITQLAALQYPKPHSLEECALFAWLAWERKAITHLEGAYTFGIADDSGCIFCKDPFGLRPLYYLKHPKGVYISNRVETLLKESRYGAVLDRSSLMELFAFGPGVSETRTYLKNIYALPMGSLLKVQKGSCQWEAIYHLEAKEHTDDLDTTIHKVHDLMCASIYQQMAGCDAAFLSGGLDSSIITSVAAAKQSGYHTYSLQYEGNAQHFKGNMYQVSLDDSFIADMCAYSGVTHTTLTMSQRSVCDLLEDAMKAREFPGMADVDSSLLWLAQQAGK